MLVRLVLVVDQHAGEVDPHASSFGPRATVERRLAARRMAACRRSIRRVRPLSADAARRDALLMSKRFRFRPVLLAALATCAFVAAPSLAHAADLCVADAACMQAGNPNYVSLEGALAAAEAS